MLNLKKESHPLYQSHQLEEILQFKVEDFQLKVKDKSEAIHQDNFQLKSNKPEDFQVNSEATHQDNLHVKLNKSEDFQVKVKNNYLDVIHQDNLHVKVKDKSESVHQD